jgi:prophage regulatory protein
MMQHERQTIAALHIPEALLKIQTVVAVTGMSESSIRRKIAEGKFPSPVKDGTRCTRWVAGKVSNWLKARGGQ